MFLFLCVPIPHAYVNLPRGGGEGEDTRKCNVHPHYLIHPHMHSCKYFDYVFCDFLNLHFLKKEELGIYFFLFKF